MTPEELAAIRARAEAATGGPWYGELGEVFSDVEHWNWIPNHEYNGAQDNADAAFIAHARADIPRLLDELERLRSVAENCCASCEDTRGHRVTDGYLSFGQAVVR